MRPDEHKRKKNEAYKKKHAIKSGGKTPNKSPQDQSTKQHCNQTTDVPAQGKITTAKRVDCDEDVAHVPSRPTFQRRKIESNWDRYSETPVSQQEERIGADFSEILAAASTGFSQFRFKDEQEWEKEEHSSITSDLLSIDCTALVSHLTCVPLHERLQIDPQHFQESQLNNFDKQSSINKSRLQSKEEFNSQTGGNNDDMGSSSQQNTSKDPTKDSILDKLRPDGVRDSAKTAEDENLLTKKIQNTARDELDDILDSESSPHELDNILGSGSNVSEVFEQTSDTGNKQRLNIGSQQTSETCPFTASENETPLISDANCNSKKTSKDTSLEDDLDALLNLDDETSKHVLQPTHANPVVTQKVESENLEDWLDSVLDD